MNRVQNIGRAIDALTPQQMEGLSVRPDRAFHSLSIRSLIKTNLHAGRIDHRISRALADPLLSG